VRARSTDGVADAAHSFHLGPGAAFA
jgi:hypothetical protein